MKIYHIEFDIDCAFNFTDSIPNFNNPIYALRDDLSIIGRDRAYQNVFFESLKKAILDTIFKSS